MKFRLLNRHFFLVIITDICLLTLSLYLSHLVRFDFLIPDRFWLSFKKILPFVLLIKLIGFYFFDLYRGMWRYFSIADVFNIVKATSLSALVIVSIVLLTTRFKDFSRSVFLIDLCFTILLVIGFRLCIRIYFVHIREHKSFFSSLKVLLDLLSKKQIGEKSLLIIGAGDCGEQIYREIRDNANLRYKIVGFLDDDFDKVGKKIHGIPVIAPVVDLDIAVKKAKADELLIAIPSASSNQMRSIVEKCKASGLPFKTIPGIGELINGRVTIGSIREFEYRDLLGREAVKLDIEKIDSYLENQIVMVTGAGGSIGSELCRQICRFRPHTMLLFERAESPLYEIELELKQNYPGINTLPILGDIRDKDQLEITFKEHSPHTIFHAAAYKHVPMLELQPWKAVDNNIIGTRNLIDISRENKVERFVSVSTDKAVRPTSIMGASKRVTEMMIQGQNSCKPSMTKFITVRFGNVVGSVGSVIPLFKNQIKNGGPITVTHPDVTRYFMTIPEASQLILQAGAMGRGGEIYILDMGSPIKIKDMAIDLIRLSGFEPEVEIKIEYIGLRPGEKLYEELITDGENILPTRHEKILVLKGIDCDLGTLNGNIEELNKLSGVQDGESVKSKLKEIVPEYDPDNTAE